VIDTLNTLRADYVNKQMRVANWVTRARAKRGVNKHRTGESKTNFLQTGTRQTEIFVVKVSAENIAM